MSRITADWEVSLSGEEGCWSLLNHVSPGTKEQEEMNPFIWELFGNGELIRVTYPLIAHDSEFRPENISGHVVTLRIKNVNPIRLLRIYDLPKA